MASAVSLNFKVLRPRMTSVECLSVKVYWIPSLQPFWMWWQSEERRLWKRKWRLFRFCWFSHKSRNQIFMFGTLWVRGKLSDVSFFLFSIPSSDLQWVGLLRACELLEPECLVQMLKAVKHLSMNATLLEVLQNANALEILIRILDEQSSGPHSTVSLFYFRISGFRNSPCFGTIGNLQSCIPDMLQPLSFEQVPSRRSCTSRYHPMLETGHRNKLPT